MMVGAVVMVIAGVVTAAVAGAARTGHLGRNHVAGIRLPSTMRSDEAWRAAHRAGFWPTVLGGAAAVVGGLVAVVLDLLDEPDAAAVVVLAAAGVLLVAVLVGGVAGVRAARQVHG